MCKLADLIYFSSRKVSSTRGGAICTNRKDLYLKIRDLVVLYEGFVTYGGMSVREIEALAVRMRETTDDTVIGQSPSFIAHLATKLDQRAIPIVLPPGALGGHIDCMGFLPHVPQKEYPAGRWRLYCPSFRALAGWNAVPFRVCATTRETTY